MEFGGSASEESSLDDNDLLYDLKDNKEKQKKFVESLKGFKVKTLPQKKLVLGIMHRKGHKNFEEQENNVDDVTEMSDMS